MGTISGLSAGAKEILARLLVDGPASRVELAARVGLSKSSLTRLAKELADDGLLADGETLQRSTPGRPSELLRVDQASHSFLGIKLTGTRLYQAVVDLHGELLVRSEEVLTSSAPSDVVAQIARAVRAAERRSPTLSGVGVTLAGVVASTPGGDTVVESEFLDWRNVPLQALLAATTEQPVFIQNDVQALTAAEHWFGVGDHLDSLVLITVGAGVGCGIVANGRLVDGASGGPGQISHLPFDPAGPICRRGHRGCVDAYLTNDAIARSVSASTGAVVDYDTAVGRARTGDAVALRAFADAGQALGQTIGTLANILDPARVVLTGDGLAVWELAEEQIRSGSRQAYIGRLEAPPLLVVPFEFDEWARAAAILAIRSALD